MIERGQKQTFSNKNKQLLPIEERMMKMGLSREEVAMIGFEIVAYSGDARTRLLNLLKEVRKGDFTKVEQHLKEADDLLKLAHDSQTKMLAAEAGGEEVELGFIFVHGQDHLMTTMLLRDIIEDMVHLYRNQKQ